MPTHSLLLRRLSICWFSVSILAVSIPVQSRDPEYKAANSVHLRWPSPEVEWFYNEATVRKSTKGSYFVLCGWNTGYMGIQELYDGSKVAIFSVWDQQTTGDNPDAVPPDKRVKPVYGGRGVDVARFGNEGTGGRSMMPFRWRIGDKVRCLVRSTTSGDQTTYEGWIWMPNQKEWKQMAAFQATTGGKHLSSLYSFVEDFRRDTRSAKEERVCESGNGWVKTVDGKVQSLTNALFTNAKSTFEDQNSINGGNVPGALFLATGGKIKKSADFKENLQVSPIPSVPPSDLPPAEKQEKK